MCCVHYCWYWQYGPCYTIEYGQISPGQVVSAVGWCRGGAGRWLGPLLTYLTMWTRGHWRNILIYLTMTLLTRRRDTVVNEETHLTFALSTNNIHTTSSDSCITIQPPLSCLLCWLPGCLSPDGWVSPGHWSVEISWSVSES